MISFPAFAIIIRTGRFRGTAYSNYMLYLGRNKKLTKPIRFPLPPEMRGKVLDRHYAEPEPRSVMTYYRIYYNRKARKMVMPKFADYLYETARREGWDM